MADRLNGRGKHLPKLAILIGRLLPNKPARQTMERKRVRKARVEALEPMLMEQGFLRFKGDVALRHSESWIDVVELTFTDTLTWRRDSPGLAVGRFFKFSPPDPLSGPVKEVQGQLWPTAGDCHLRKRMFHLKRPKDTTWIIEKKQQLAQCCAEAQQLLRNHAFPWFSWLDDLEMVLRLLREGKPDIEGKLRDPLCRGVWNFGNDFSRYVVAGMVAFQLGRKALCVDLLAPVLKAGGTLGRSQQVLPLPTETLSVIQRTFDAAVDSQSGEPNGFED